MRMRWGTFGTDYQTGTFDAWQSGQKMNHTSNSPINFNSATGDYIQITGVQVELGDTATSFEHRRSEELLRCQRYFYQSSHWGTASGTGYAALGINYTGYQTAVGNWIWVNVYWP